MSSLTTTSSVPRSARWTHRWIPAPDLHRTYLAVVMPGGAAVESVLDLPPGVSHLCEHLLYRQNALTGHRMDQLGGKFGLQTTREYMYALLIFDPAEAAGAADLIRQWLERPRIEPETLQLDAAIVADEVEQHRRSGLFALHQEVMALLAPGSHLQRDFAGLPQQIRALAAGDVRHHFEQIAALGGVMVAVGPTSPWPAALLDEPGAPVWRAPALPLPPEQRRTIVRLDGHAHATVLSACLYAGRSSEQVLGAFGAYASLEYGKLHPLQQRFHDEWGLRHLDIDLRVYADVSVLVAMARCPNRQTDAVAAALEELVETAGTASSGERIGRVTRHHLGWMLDRPDLRAVEEGARLLFGHRPLADTFRAACATAPDDLPALVEQARRSRATSAILGPVTR